eukprot:UN13937
MNLLQLYCMIIRLKNINITNHQKILQGKNKNFSVMINIIKVVFVHSSIKCDHWGIILTFSYLLF